MNAQYFILREIIIHAFIYILHTHYSHHISRIIFSRISHESKLSEYI